MLLYGSLGSVDQRYACGGQRVLRVSGIFFTATGARKTRVLRNWSTPCFLLRHAFAYTGATAIFENLDDYETLRAKGIVAALHSVVIRGAGVDESRFFASSRLREISASCCLPVPDAMGQGKSANLWKQRGLSGTHDVYPRGSFWQDAGIPVTPAVSRKSNCGNGRRRDLLNGGANGTICRM